MAICVLILGAIIGSFLSVCIYRIPYGRVPETLDGAESTVDQEAAQKKADSQNQQVLTVNSPSRSFCPACKKQLHWYHNVPVLSWICLFGKCAFCKAPISGRYPLVECLSALFAYLSWVQFGATPTAALIYLFCATLIVISFIDYDYFIIPNVISIPGTIIGFAIAVTNHFTGIFVAPVVPDIMSLLELDFFILFLKCICDSERKKALVWET
jgi:leader peptidase (prepilin peptidase)/N-methyltransferase